MAITMTWDAWHATFVVPDLCGEDLRNCQKLAFAGCRIVRQGADDYHYQWLKYALDAAFMPEWMTNTFKTKAQCEDAYRQDMKKGAHDLHRPMLFGVQTAVYRLRHDRREDGTQVWSMWCISAGRKGGSWYKVQTFETPEEVVLSMAAVAQSEFHIEDFDFHRAEIAALLRGGVGNGDGSVPPTTAAAETAACDQGDAVEYQVAADLA